MKNESGIEPCGHYILVLPDKVDGKTKGGLYLPNESVDNAKRDTTRGTLVAIGPIGWNDFDDGAPWAYAGDRVTFGKYAGRDMKGKDGLDYILMNAEDILAVLSGEVE